MTQDLNQWCKKCGPRAKCGPRRHELWPAEGLKISIVMRPAKLRSAARVASGDSKGALGGATAPPIAKSSIVMRPAKFQSAARGGPTPPPGRELCTGGKKQISWGKCWSPHSLFYDESDAWPARFFGSQNMARGRKSLDTAELEHPCF